MKRDYARDVINEGARLFGLDPRMLFADWKDAGAEAAECAVVYTLWLTHDDRASIGRYCGQDHIMEKVHNCVTCRKVSKDYDKLVGELVWFAQRWTDNRQSAA